MKILKDAGVSMNNMRIMIVRDMKAGGIVHAILEVKIGSKKYILDNQSESALLKTSVTRYMPVYAINKYHWWL